MTLKKSWKIRCRDEIDETHSEIGSSRIFVQGLISEGDATKASDFESLAHIIMLISEYGKKTDPNV